MYNWTALRKNTSPLSHFLTEETRYILSQLTCVFSQSQHSTVAYLQRFRGPASVKWLFSFIKKKVRRGGSVCHLVLLSTSQILPNAKSQRKLKAENDSQIYGMGGIPGGCLPADSFRRIASLIPLNLVIHLTQQENYWLCTHGSWKTSILPFTLFLWFWTNFPHQQWDSVPFAGVSLSNHSTDSQTSTH